ncbi:DUF11 domain-containing protein [Sulfidibacter corallicola]|uniref:DUF11 domain-containing protein n=1 Tax=Sulfidibacter corallicola TaxID=2818388 RepID=A0A8A4TMW7_SULCO|nr:hypothetical protein [Sulfidibacter corallicola]QTD50442.1 DUF11 domain-containing protein [Sulfidibacter corallicola]
MTRVFTRNLIFIICVWVGFGSFGLLAQVDLAISVSPSPARVGEMLDLEFTVVNGGAFDRQDLTLVFDHPQGLESISESLIDGDCPSTTCEPGEQMSFQISSLPAGEGITFSVPMRAADSADGTQITLEAEVLDDETVQATATATLNVADRFLELALTENRDPVAPGGTIDYTLTYGLVDTSLGAAGVVLDFEIPEGTQVLSADGGQQTVGHVTWQLGNLNPGQSGERLVRLQIDEGQGLGTILTARASLEDGGGGAVTYTADTRVAAATPLQVVVTASPDPVRPGETLDLELTATNTGDTAVSGVSLVLEIPSHFASLAESLFDGDCHSTTCETRERAIFAIGELAAGEGVQFSIPARVDSDTDDGSVTLFEVELHANNGVQMETGAAIRVQNDRVLELALVEDRDPVQPGEVFTYSLTYGILETSAGSPDTVLTLYPPPEVSVLSTPEGATLDGNRVSFDLGNLNLGSSGQLDVLVQVDQGTPAGQSLMAVAELVNGDGDHNEVRIETASRVRERFPLALGIVASPDPIRRGETMDLEITVTNNDDRERTGITVTLEVPDHIASLSESLFDGDCHSTTCETRERATFSVGTLPAGKGFTYSVPMRIVDTALNGTVTTFEAELVDSTGVQRESATSLRVDQRRTLEMALVADRDPAAPGDRITYTVTYGLLSSGNGVAGNTLTLAIPEGTQFVSASHGGRFNEGRVTWTPGTMNPGDSAEVRATVEVNDEVTLGSQLWAQAELSGPNSVPPQLRHETLTRVEPVLPLELRLTASPDPLAPNEYADVLLTVTNTGAFDRSGLVASLTWPDHLASLSENHFAGDCASTSCETRERALFDIGTLPAGEGVVFSLPPQIADGTLDGTVLTLDAEVGDTSGDLRRTGANVAVKSDRALDIGLVSMGDPVQAGTMLTYQLRFGSFQNADPLAGGSIEFDLPDGTELVEAVNGAMGCNQVTWQSCDLDPGDTSAHLVTVAVAPDLPLGTLLEASVSVGEATDPFSQVRARAVTRVGEVAPLQLTLDAVPDRVDPGDLLSLSFSVTNTTAFNRSGVLAWIEYPPQLASIAESQTGGDCISTTCEVPERVFYDLDVLQGGETQQFDFDPTVLETVTPGTILHINLFVEDSTGFKAASNHLVQIGGDAIACDPPDDSGIDMDDFRGALSDWLRTGAPNFVFADHDGSGNVDVLDYTALADELPPICP